MNNEITITEEESKRCGICNNIFKSCRLMKWHVKREHKLNFEHYIICVYYGGIRPVCLKTGNDIKFKGHKLGPWFPNYSRNNFPRNPHSNETKKKIKLGCEKTSLKKYGVKNVFETDWCKEKIKITIQDKYGVTNIMKVNEVQKQVLESYFKTMASRPRKIYKKGEYDPNKPSSLELDLKEKLDNLNIEFHSPYVFNGKRYDFYIPVINSVIEIDGTAFHKNTLDELTLITINGSVNDYNKTNNIKEEDVDFNRIRYNPKDFSFNTNDKLISEINKNKYTPDYRLTYKQKIVTKEYFKRYIESHGKEKLEKYVYLFLKFIRTFHPEFPYPDIKEDIGEVINKISNINEDSIFNPLSNEFINNTSTVGINLLKNYFKSYWKSSYKGALSPIEAWNDDNIMRRVIKYRIGCNDSDEMFDFSLHQLIRGLSARRITISFFKPALASAIYSHYLKGIETPTVFDPCCGFGGRLLGFKSKYPNGTYIGCEPNHETYNELLTLSQNAGWNNVQLYNSKIEDFNLNIKADLIFTSIPYFDTEKYSNNCKYHSFTQWKNEFIKSIENLKNVGPSYINCNEEIAKKLKWENQIDATIKSNTSHFNKKNNTKLEYIIKL